MERFSLAPGSTILQKWKNSFFWALGSVLRRLLRARDQSPQYFKQVGDQRVAIPPSDVPQETRLLSARFKLAKPGPAYTSPQSGAWTTPGPKAGPLSVALADGSIVTYYWYRFVDQPSFQQYKWSVAKKRQLQMLVERLHATWPTNRDYMAPPTTGKLVSLDPALLVKPPKGLEVGYVPIVTGQVAHASR